MLVLTGPATAQTKKTKVQKREKYEFSFDLPSYVEQLKQELTYPLAWRNSGIKRFAKWQKRARAKVFECMMTPPKTAGAEVFELLGSHINWNLLAIIMVNYYIQMYSRH